MNGACARALRGWMGSVSLCASIIGVLTTARAGQKEEARGGPQRPMAIAAAKTKTFVYAPADRSSARPAIVYLHGRCGRSDNGCPYFHAGAEPFGWLVCPQANVACEGGGSSWGGGPSEREEIVDGAIDAVARMYPGALDVDAARVLVGFSQGVWTALDVARAKPGKYRGLLLIGADVDLHADDVRRMGVARIVFAAGKYDAAYAPMMRIAQRLESAGTASRFVSLGGVGHTYATEGQGTIDAALAWVEGRTDELGH